jgi:hypothetical protein
MFVRLSLSKPAAQSRQEALGIEDHLLAHFSTLPGFVEGYRLENPDYIGRVTLWDSQSAADHAAGDSHTMASRSRLVELQLMREADTFELSFEGSPPLRPAS